MTKDGVRGTEVIQEIVTFEKKEGYRCTQRLGFVAFEDLPSADKRLSCQGLRQNAEGVWVFSSD
jgi:hypothetical protein